MGDERTGATAVMEPPSPPAPGAPAAAGRSEPPRKRRRGCLIALAVAVGLTLLGAVAAALLIERSSEPEDVGITYSEEDFDAVLGRIGVVWPELPEGADPADYERVYSGQKPLDVTLTEAELSALMSFRHGESYWPVKSMTVDLTGGDTARISGVVTYAGRDWPVSAGGSGSISGAALDVSLESARVAGIDVPAEYLPYGERFLELMVSDRLSRISGFGVDSFEVTDAGVRIVGTTWETAEYVRR